MKNCFFIFVILLFAHKVTAQNIGIGTSTPDSSAILDISSTDKGYLLPRMTFAQRNAIPNPATGLMVWCTDCNEMQVFNGTIWKNMSGAAASGISLPGVRICYQQWIYKNLDVRTYGNGDTIPLVTDPVAWANLTTGAMCWYNNDSATFGAIYGRLYNWYAVNDPRGLSPSGWHIPSNEEWSNLGECLGGDSIAGGKMKAVSALWIVPNSGATNRTGFTGLPGGSRNENGLFSNLGNNGYWWSSTGFSGSNGWYCSLFNAATNLIRVDKLKTYGFSVRFVKN